MLKDQHSSLVCLHKCKQHSAVCRRPSTGEDRFSPGLMYINDIAIEKHLSNAERSTFISGPSPHIDQRSAPQTVEQCRIRCRGSDLMHVQCTDNDIKNPQKHQGNADRSTFISGLVCLHKNPAAAQCIIENVAELDNPLFPSKYFAILSVCCPYSVYSYKLCYISRRNNPDLCERRREHFKKWMRQGQEEGGLGRGHGAPH